MKSKAFRGEIWTNVHPTLMQRMLEANAETVDGAVAKDSHSCRAAELMQTNFSTPVAVSFALNGTGANVLALKGILSAGDTVVCTEQTHINTDECGALEYTVGTKILTIKSPDGKMTPALLDTLLKSKVKYHPKVLAVTQPTEFGTLYSLDELKAICAHAHSLGLHVFLDGARLGSAAAALNATMNDLIEKTDVDIFTFGGTKAGAMFGEMIVSRRAEFAKNASYLQKQSMQHLDKSKFLGVQMACILEENLWVKTGGCANQMARILERRLREKNIEIRYPVQTNMVFCVIPPELFSRITEQFDLHYWDEATHLVRLATTYLTSEKEIDALVSLI